MATALILLVLAIFYWNEARKEIVFLCGNFTQGISEQSVRRQLDTGNFLSYRNKNVPSGELIIVESAYNLWMTKCIIDFDSSGQVQKSVIK